MKDSRPTTTRDGAYSIRSVHRVCDILDLLKVGQAVPLAEIAQASNLPKTSAFRYLASLESRHYVQREPGTGGYRLGSAFLGVPAQHLDMLMTRARPRLEQLCETTGETINLGVLDGQEVLLLDIVEPQRGLRLAAQRGDRDPIHCTALGKVLASRLDGDRIRAMLRNSGMPRRTPATIIDPEVYMREIAGVRAQGYALDDCENEADGRCLAVPLDAEPVSAAISMSAPSSRFPVDTVEQVAALLSEAAAALRDEAANGDLA